MPENNYSGMLQKLKQIKTGCVTMPKFTPLQQLIKLPAIESKISEIETLNHEINTLESELNKKRQNRIVKIKGLTEKHGEDGIIRLSRQAVNYVDALGQEYSSRHQMLKKLIIKMQPKGKKKTDKKRINNGSQQSYEAITRAAEEFYSIIKDISVYEPADIKISKAKYLDKINEIKSLSADITHLYNELKPRIDKRYQEYHSKTNGIRKIITETKKYVRGNWGQNSHEYETIKVIKL